MIRVRNDDNTISLNCNKGVLFNLAGIMAYKDMPNVSNIIFQEPFYLPSFKLLENYFQHIESGKVINFDLTLNDNMNLFGVNKKNFVEYISYPNHIWLYTRIDQIYKSILEFQKTQGFKIGNIVLEKDDLIDTYPEYRDNTKYLNLPDIVRDDLALCNIESGIDIENCPNARELLTQISIEFPEFVKSNPIGRDNITQYLFKYNYNMFPISLLANHTFENPFLASDQYNEICVKVIKLVAEYIDNTLDINGTITDKTYSFKSGNYLFIKRLIAILKNFKDTLLLGKNPTLILNENQKIIISNCNFNLDDGSDGSVLLSFNNDFDLSGGNELSVNINVKENNLLDKKVVILSGKNKHKIGTVIKENINNVKIDVGDRVVTLKVNYDFLDNTLVKLDDLELNEEDKLTGTLNEEFGNIIGFVNNDHVVFQSEDSLKVEKYSDFLENNFVEKRFELGDSIMYNDNNKLYKGIIIQCLSDKYTISVDVDGEENLIENVEKSKISQNLLDGFV